MAQPAEHASPQAGGGRPVSAETQGGARGRTDSDTDHGAVPVLAARIALRRASSRAAHKGLLGRLGPGLITGASDDDPSGIATYSQTGAQFGYAMCWVMALDTCILDRAASNGFGDTHPGRIESLVAALNGVFVKQGSVHTGLESLIATTGVDKAKFSL
jgi:hypothetical protein